jgi:UDP-2,3-diacylglucosamine pyrophosphatase LpxH
VTTEVKIVFSDIHMGTGTRRGRVNPWEDFHQDDRMVDLILHYCQGAYAGMPVEIIINGDFLDLLKVRHRGEFVTEVTEEVSIDKVARCIRGHPEVFDALATFLARPRKQVTYIAGNHDLDIAFPAVQRMLRARLGVADDATNLRFLVDQGFYRLPGGVTVAHGHLFEIMNRPRAGLAISTLPDGRRILNLPFGSLFFTRALAPVKAEQPLIDLVYPLSSFILWGLVFDLRFTLRVLWRMIRFVAETRLNRTLIREAGLVRTLEILIEEIALYNNVERQAFKLLQASDDMSTLIVGHTHGAKIRRFPHNKIYVNTGTWVKLVSLDLHDLGTRLYLTYTLVEYKDKGPPDVRLLRWRGMSRVHEDVLA